MDVERTKDERIAQILVRASTELFLECVAPLVALGMEINEDELKATTDAMLQRMQNAMHWLPMTEDAVLEKGAIYLLRDKHDGSVGVAEWMEGVHGFAMSIDYLENRENFTHYARITEPK